MAEFNLKGSYILVINLSENTYINIGALGNLFFKKGFYFYIGSAMGEKGSSTIINRVKRHLKPASDKKTHWHIDYFLEDENSVIIRMYLIPSVLKLECKIAQEIFNGSDGYIKNFGSSDCNCLSHLLYFEHFKSLKEIYKKDLSL